MHDSLNYEVWREGNGKRYILIASFRMRFMAEQFMENFRKTHKGRYLLVTRDCTQREIYE